jgi:hypothetical protein
MFKLFMAQKEKITLSIDSDLWKKVKHHCIDAKLEYSSFVENLIKEKFDKKK